MTTILGILFVILFVYDVLIWSPGKQVPEAPEWVKEIEKEMGIIRK